MGSRTDEAAQRVEEQRRRITGMLDDLDRRVHDDMQGIRETAQDRVTGITDRASSLQSQFQDRLPSTEQIEGQVTAHPLTSVLGGFGAGVALGLVSGGMGSDDDDEDWRDDRRRSSRSDSRRGSGGGGSRAFDMMSAAAMSSVAGPIREEASTLFRQAVAGFMGTDDRNGHEGGEQRRNGDRDSSDRDSSRRDSTARDGNRDRADGGA